VKAAPVLRLAPVTRSIALFMFIRACFGGLFRT
jgi:hypothetical protein